MNNKENKNIFTENNIQEKDKSSTNLLPILGKIQLESKDYYNLAIPNFELVNLKSASKVFKQSNQSK